MRIDMRQFGTTLCTRASGRAAYDLISSALSSGGAFVELDFSAVDSVTNSFADEAFGRLAEERGIAKLRTQTTFKNINRDSALMIRCAMDRHDAKAEFAFG